MKTTNIAETTAAQFSERAYKMISNVTLAPVNTIKESLILTPQDRVLKVLGAKLIPSRIMDPYGGVIPTFLPSFSTVVLSGQCNIMQVI